MNMIITWASQDDSLQAITELNIKYEGNLIASTIIPCNLYPDRPKYKINLLVKDLNGKGGRKVYTNRINPFSCFHAHFDFFNRLIEINPKTVITVSEDWIIKRDPVENKIIGNPLIRDKSRIHRIKPSSYICNCNK